jgi:phytoene dehydrogenase-like protein
MYDAIIIGRDLSSLVAALATSRRGLKTLLVNEGSNVTEYRESGYIFPIDPTPLVGFRPEQTSLRLLTGLHLSMDEVPELLLMNPAFQVILPGHRIDLFHDRNQFIADIIREFPQHEKEIRRFYSAVSKNSTLIEHWIREDSADKANICRRLIRGIFRLTMAFANRTSLIIRGNGDLDALRSVIKAQIAMFSYLNINCFPFPISAAYLLTLPTRGVFCPVGGRNTWLSWLRKKFTDAGGELIDECSIMRIDTKPEINIDLASSGVSSTIRGKKLIVSAQWEKLNFLLFHQKFLHHYVNRLDCYRPYAHPFCLHMGIYEEGIPEKLSPYSVVVPDENKLAWDHNFLFLEVSLPGDTYRAPDGRRALSATVYLKDSPLVLDDLELKIIAKTIIDSLDCFFPFLRESIDYINIEKSIVLTRQSQEVINKKYYARKGAIIAMKTLSQKSPFPNVLLTGGIFRAGLGFEGEILSGIDAASMIESEF